MLWIRNQTEYGPYETDCLARFPRDFRAKKTQAFYISTVWKWIENSYENVNNEDVVPYELYTKESRMK